ncbi:MAG: adenylate/guanylate cyclase domain-containing response regulator, partial [Phototrophicales bacterium]
DYYALMFEAITGHGGSVNQMIGDGLMAIFGAPVHYADHCDRAVRAALEMLELLNGFNQDRTARDKARIRIGIGIATGKMVAGFTGTHHRATYTCVGDTVNLASRIESHTKAVDRPILIDKFTRNKLAADIQVEDLG